MTNSAFGDQLDQSRSFRSFPILKTRAYYRGVHVYSFRSGEWAEIVGVTQLRDNLCYVVLYSDGVEDQCPVSDIGMYEVTINKGEDK